MSEGAEAITSAKIAGKNADGQDVAASISTGSADGSKHGPAAGGKLESLSREDLIKFVKKQTMLLTKTRSQAEAIAEEKKALEAKLAIEAERTAMLEEDHQAAVAAYNAAQEAQVQAAAQIKVLEEQLQETAASDRHRQQQSLSAAVSVQREQALLEEIECLKMKNATLTDSVRRLQTDYQALAAERSELSTEIDRLRSVAHETASIVEAELQQARLALDEQRSAADALQAELATAHKTTADLSRQLDDERRSSTEAATRLAEVERLAAVALQQRIGELEVATAATVAGLEAKLAAAAAELDSLRCRNQSAADDAAERLCQALARADSLTLAESRTAAELEQATLRLAAVPQLEERLRETEAAAAALQSELEERVKAAERNAERQLASTKSDLGRSERERLACEQRAEAGASELRTTIKCLEEELLSARQQSQDLQCEQQAARRQHDEFVAQQRQETLRLVRELEEQGQKLQQEHDELIQLQQQLEQQRHEQQQGTLELCRQQELVQQQSIEIERQQLYSQQQKDELRLLRESCEQQQQEAADRHREECCQLKEETKLQQEERLQELEALRLQHQQQLEELASQSKLIAELRSSLAELDARCCTLAERDAAAERSAELERVQRSELVERTSQERVCDEAEKQMLSRSIGSAHRLRECLVDVVALLRQATHIDESGANDAETDRSSCEDSIPDDKSRSETVDTDSTAGSDSSKLLEPSPAADDDQQLVEQARDLTLRLAQQCSTLTATLHQAQAASSEAERIAAEIRVATAAEAAACAEIRHHLESEADLLRRKLQGVSSDCELLGERCDAMQHALQRAEAVECELRSTDNDRRRRCEQLEADLSLAASTVDALRCQCNAATDDAARSRADLAEALLSKQSSLHEASEAARSDLMLVQRDLEVERQRTLALDAELRLLQKEADGRSAEQERVARELHDALVERDDLAKRLQALTESLHRAGEFRDVAESAHQDSGAAAATRERDTEIVAETRELEFIAAISSPASCKSSDVARAAAAAEESHADELPSQAAETKLAELEARCSKFKAIALKAKKEAAELKKSYDQAVSDVKRLTIEKAALSEQLQSDTERFSAARAELASTLQNLQRTYESVHASLDVEQGRRTELEQAVTRAARELAVAREQLAEASASQDSLEKQLEAATKKAAAAEALSSEMAARISATDREKEALRRQLSESEAAAAASRQVEEAWRTEEARLRSEIKIQEERLQAALTEHEQLRQTISKSSLMDLEIADYEKAVEAFQARLREKDTIIGALQKDLEHAQQRVKSFESQLELSEGQRKQAEERGDKLKQLYAKMRKELAEAKDLEMQLRSEEAALHGQAEAAKQREDASRVELTEAIAARSTLEERLRAAGEAQQRLAAAHELRQRQLQDDLGAAQERLAALQADYDGYKIRVHSVLKQQKSKSCAEAALEVERETRNRLEIVVEQLKMKLAESSNSFEAIAKEREALQEEHERLLNRHAGCAQELHEKEADWKQRLEAAAVDAALAAARSEATEHDQRIAHAEVLRRALDEQRQSLSAEHERALAARDVAIAEADDERQRLQREVRDLQRQLQTATSSSGVAATVAAKHLSQPRHHHWTAANVSERLSTPSGDDGFAVQEIRGFRADPSDTGNLDGSVPLSAISLLQREEGEGMEQPASPGPLQLHQQLQLQLQNRHVLFGSSQPMSPATGGLVPFEQLLTDDAVSVRSVGSTVLPDDGAGGTLKPRLLSLEKQAEHLRELLNESETSNNHLREQTRVLKDEIRRLERNQERDNSISNMEYLKNIVLKFLSLKTGEEKAQLVPVLSTMLRLSHEECYQMDCAARGSDAQAVSGTSQAPQKGWGAYIPRWTGLS